MPWRFNEFDIAAPKVSELENRSLDISQTETQREKRTENPNMWSNMKLLNKCVTGRLDRREEGPKTV
jgi:hypothetical protein